MCVVPRFDGLIPGGHVVPVAECARELALQTSSPAVPTFVVGQSVQDCSVGCLLQVHVKSCVDPQSRFMNLLRAVLPLEVPPDLFDEVWRQRVWIVMYLQSYRSIPGCRTLCSANSL